MAVVFVALRVALDISLPRSLCLARIRVSWHPNASFLFYTEHGTCYSALELPLKRVPLLSCLLLRGA